MITGKRKAPPLPDSYRLKSVGGWNLWVDHTLGDSCFVMRAYKRGGVFRIGFNPSPSNGYIVLANRAWKSLSTGSKYPIELRFGDRPPWNGNATARKVGDVVALYMDFAGDNLITEMARADVLSIKYQEQIIVKIGLTAAATVDELNRCQARANGARLSPAPGGESGPVVTDPFAR